MPLIVTDSPLFASYTMIEFLLQLASNSDLAPCAARCSCCEMGHVHNFRGRIRHIPCDKEAFHVILRQLFFAKSRLLNQNASHVLLLWLTMAARNILTGAHSGLPADC